MSGPLPLVSVIVPAFNAARTIGETLLSVIAQTYGPIEIIVVDDGSTDDTSAVVSRMMERDRRIRIVRQHNQGVAAARNRGLSEASGTYVAPIDADDIWLPQNLARQVQALEACGSADFSFAASFVIDEGGHKQPLNEPDHARRRGDFAGLLRRNWVGNGSAAVFRREAVLAAGGYDQSLKTRNAQGAEDWKLVLLLAAKRPGLVIEERLIGYRRRQSSMSMEPSAMTRSTMIVLDEMRRTGPRIAPWTFWHARTTIHIGLFYRWVYAGQWFGAAACLLRAYGGNPLWFTQQDARSFLFAELLPHVFRRAVGLRGMAKN